MATSKKTSNIKNRGRKTSTTQSAQRTKKSAAKKSSSSKKAAKTTISRKKPTRKWSKRVNETSDALDLDQGVFQGKDPKKDSSILETVRE